MYLGMVQLLLEYGVAPTSRVQGLLQKLTWTADMEAVAVLQARNFDIREARLPNGQTMLHRLVSTQCCDLNRYRCLKGDMQNTINKDMKEWHDQAMPSLRLLLSIDGVTLKRDEDNKTAMDVCRKEYRVYVCNEQRYTVTSASGKGR